MMRWDSTVSPAANARAVLPRLARKYLAAGRRAARKKATTQQLHQFRLLTKRFRYSLEIFQPLYGSGVKQKLEVIRRIQSCLGDINDCVTAGSMPVIGGQSRMAAWLDRRQKQRAREFQNLWRRYFAPPNDRRWITYWERYIQHENPPVAASAAPPSPSRQPDVPAPPDRDGQE